MAIDDLRQMDRESQSARQQDTNKMKEGIPQFFASDADTVQNQLPPVPRDKSGRGFNNFATARALCPRAHIYDFNHDDEYVLASSCILY